MDTGICIITRDPSEANRWIQWKNPAGILETRNNNEVLSVLADVDTAISKGHFALGFVAYEAGQACDSHFTSHVADGNLPLVWFALFENLSSNEVFLPAATTSSTRWQSSESRTAYRNKILKIKDHIAAGDTYQVNFTFPLRTHDPINPKELFFSLYAGQPSPYAMYIETPFFQIASASPELFFKLDGEQICCEPMKGTSPRGLHPDLDSVMGKQLQESTKNRAENVMIVDMVRNDLSRIAAPGTVQVDELFKVSRWPTLWQMTSKVSAKTAANLPELFTALFPSASITGTPKLKTSEIIADLESNPRGVYTGAIGWWFPNRQAQFAVAIRTAVRQEKSNTTTYGIGSGIVWDSIPDEEYRECLLKSRILRGKISTFSLLETMRWEPVRDYVLLDEHLIRMKKSADYFSFTCNISAVREKLAATAKHFDPAPQRIRLLLAQNGDVTIEHHELSAPGHYADPSTAPVLTARVDKHRIDLNSPFLYHKTTRRVVYEQARRRYPDVDETLLMNTCSGLMEFSTGNLVIKRGAEWLTPAIENGLLPGVFRDHLISRGEIKPAQLTESDLAAADEIYFINSVRGWRRVHML